MSPKQVGIRIDRDGGDHPVFCCQDSMEKWHALVDVQKAMQTINNYFNPQGFIRVINYGALPEMNYCPVCGTKYEKETKK